MLNKYILIVCSILNFRDFVIWDFVKQSCSWRTRIYWPRIYHDETRNKYYFSCLRERSYVRSIALSASPVLTDCSCATLVSALQLKLNWDLFPATVLHSRFRSVIF